MTPEDRAAVRIMAMLVDDPDGVTIGAMSAVIAEAVAAEREACAAICDDAQAGANRAYRDSADPGAGCEGARDAAEAIRARGTQ